MITKIDRNFNFLKNSGRKAVMVSCANSVEDDGPRECRKCEYGADCRMYETIFIIKGVKFHLLSSNDYYDDYLPDEGDVINIMDDRFTAHKQKLAKQK